MEVVAEDIDRVKAELIAVFEAALDRLFAGVDDGSFTLRAVEMSAWKELLGVGRLLIACLFGRRCWNATLGDLQERGFGVDDVRLRLDKDYWATVMTTFGLVVFPMFAYREPRGAVSVTRTPARSTVLPFHDRCRSSVLALEWEARVGAAHPFRQAEEELTFFTQGSLTTEDTTIARHLVRVGSMVDRSWLYATPEKIREILRTKATRDKKTDRPILYISCDAHAERRYVDETWNAQWKMVNGIRIWCEDWETGQIIHLGGEFTWGDCHAVKQALKALITSGILPKAGNYGDEVVAQFAWISDAMPWFDEHLIPLFPEAIVILDLYHLLRWFSVFSSLAFGSGSKGARRLLRTANEAIFGAPPKEKTTTTPPTRRGHKKRRRPHKRHAHDDAPRKYANIKRSGEALATALLDALAASAPKRKKAMDELELLVNRIANNVLRMGYKALLSRGFQVGSGAMESIHRTGCQLRTKRPGAKWLKETAQAIFNLRMLRLVGNWDAFWAQPDLLEQLVVAFRTPPANDASVQGELTSDLEAA